MATSGSKTVTFDVTDSFNRTVPCQLTWSWWVKSLDPENSKATISWKASLISNKKVVSNWYGYGSPAWNMTALNIDTNTYHADSGGYTYDENTIYGQDIWWDEFTIDHTPAAWGRTEVTFTLTGHDVEFENDYGMMISGRAPTVTLRYTFTLDAPMKGGRILNVNNFTDEETPVVEYSLDYLIIESLKCKMQIGSYSITRDLPIVSTGSYNFTLSDTERDNIRTALHDKASSEAKFTIYTDAGAIDAEQIIEHSVSKTVTIVNAAPIVTPTWTNNGPNDFVLNGHNSIDVSFTATPLKYATIQSQYITCGSKKINAASGTFTDISSETINFVAVDSRGLSTTVPVTIPLIEYTKLTCNIESTDPVQNLGQQNITVTFNISGAFYNGSFNDGGSPNALTLNYRTTIDGNTGSWTWLNKTISGNSYSTSIAFTLEYNQQITLEVQAQDSVATVTTTTTSKQVLPTFDWDKDDFNFNVPVYISGNEVPSIVEEGTSSNGRWTYRLWSNGIAECWAKVQVTTNISTAWGNLYSSGAINSTNLTFPFTFKEIPVVTASLSVMSAAALLMPPGGTSYKTSTSQTGAYELVRPSTISNATYLINYIVRGRWK